MQSGEQIRIAGNLPLTGPIADFCATYPKGFLMGIDDGCKMHGMRRELFKVDFQDNTGKPVTAVTVMNKQMIEKPALYISGVTPESLAIAKPVGATGIPHLFVSFDPFLCRDNKNSLRILPHYKLEGPAYVEYAKKVGAKKVMILANNNSGYNSEFQQIVEPGLKALGISSKREVFEFDQKDFRMLSMKAIEYKPDLVVVAGFSVHVYPMVNSLRSLGLKADKMICTLDFVDLLHNGTSREELAGIPFIAPGYELNMKQDEPWRVAFEKDTGRKPGYVEAYAFDTGRILVESMKQHGSVSCDAIRKVMPFKGVSGDIQVDRDGDLSTALFFCEVAKDGKVHELKLH